MKITQKEVTMNFHVLNQKQDVSKSGKLTIALYPNAFLEKKNGQKKWYARVVNRRKLEMSDIADDMVANNVTIEDKIVSRTVILEIWRQINNAIISRLAEGLAVNTGICSINLAITGSFAHPNDSFDASKHGIELRYRSESSVADILNSLEPTTTQAILNAPYISHIEDSQSENVLSIGNYIKIYGKSIKIAGTDESVGLYFENMNDNSDVIKITASELFHNTNSCLMCKVPDSLTKDSLYRIRIVTQFYSNSYLKKEPFETEFTDLAAV